MTTHTEPDLWSDKGVYASYFPGYRPRPQQAQLYDHANHVLQNGGALIAEAGTGTGKSLAYLTPAIRMALAKNETVIVSTATINLQEQLVRKDIPQAVAALEQAGVIPQGEFRYATLKGMSNYLCRHNFEGARERAITRAPSPEAESLHDKIEQWTTTTGDRAGLDLGPGEYGPWIAVSAQFHERCPYYNAHENCYLQQARLQARNAHLIVVNHALYLADLDNGGNQLGDVKHLIVDEAHKLEEAASAQFGWTLNRHECLEHIEPLCGDPMLGYAATELKDAWENYWQTLAKNLPEPQGQHDVPQAIIDDRLRKTPQWAETRSATSDVADRIESLMAFIELERERCLKAGDSHRIAELQPAHDTATEQHGLITNLAKQSNTDHVQWLDYSDRSGVVIHSTPIDVSTILAEKVFKPLDAIILTSATLASGPDDFSHNRAALGFPQGGVQLQLPSPFDYRNQARLSLPEDIPNPRDWRHYNDAVADAVADLAESLDGHTLALFTSYAALNNCARQIRKRMNNASIQVLAQGADGRPESIIRRYRENPRSVILGAASFWEGVDLDDPPLRAVAVCRLPFPVPTDPVINARSERCDHPFGDYHLPQAVIRFRQGCGRLIRSDRSRGSVVILDPRVSNSGYGRRFIDSLPEYTQERHPAWETGPAAARWLDAA